MVHNTEKVKRKIQVNKFIDGDNRKVIQLYDVTKQRELIGSYVEGQLMNIYVMNMLLACIEMGYDITINDQWGQSKGDVDQH